MKTSCIEHPKNERLVLIREWQVIFCEGNVTAAALMSFFEYWHNIKLEISKKNDALNKIAEAHGGEGNQDTTLLQFHTEQDLIQGILGIAKRDKIRESIKYLEQKQVISVHSNPNERYGFDRTRYFLFNPDILNEWLEALKNQSSENRPRSSEIHSPSSENRPRSSEIHSTITETTFLDYSQEVKPPISPKGERDGEVPINPDLVATNLEKETTPTPVATNQVKKEEGTGVVRQTGTTEQPNYDDAFLSKRRQNRLTGNYMSGIQDEWMESANRPNKAFTQWLYQKRYEKQGKLFADAVSEILNNCERAALLWDEYQAEQEKRTQHQALLQQNGMALAPKLPTQEQAPKDAVLPPNYRETATAPEIKRIKKENLPHFAKKKPTRGI